MHFGVKVIATACIESWLHVEDAVRAGECAGQRKRRIVGGRENRGPSSDVRAGPRRADRRRAAPRAHDAHRGGGRLRKDHPGAPGHRGGSAACARAWHLRRLRRTYARDRQRRSWVRLGPFRAPEGAALLPRRPSRQLDRFRRRVRSRGPPRGPFRQGAGDGRTPHRVRRHRHAPCAARRPCGGARRAPAAAPMALRKRPHGNHHRKDRTRRHWALAALRVPPVPGRLRRPPPAPPREHPCQPVSPGPQVPGRKSLVQRGSHGDDRPRRRGRGIRLGLARSQGLHGTRIERRPRPRRDARGRLFPAAHAC